MKEEEKNDILPKEEKKYQKPTIIELGKLMEETKGTQFPGALQDSGGGNSDYSTS